jgi:phosphomannomutase
MPILLPGHDGLRSDGKITVWDCPIPVIAYNTLYLNSVGTFMCTISRHPALHCGIKYIPDYAGFAIEVTDTIVANIARLDDLRKINSNRYLYRST